MHTYNKYQSLGTSESCSPPPLLTLTDTENEPISILSPNFPLSITPAAFSINGSSTDINAVVPFFPYLYIYSISLP